MMGETIPPSGARHGSAVDAENIAGALEAMEARTNAAASASEGRPRRRRSRLPAVDIGLNLVSMIDVVLFLLMYFMMTMNFSHSERLFAMEAPASEDGTAEDGGATAGNDPFDLPDEPIVIAISTVGPGAGDYRLHVDLALDSQPGNFEALFRFLDDNQVRPDHPAGLFMPDNPIVIRATPTTRWEHAVNVVNAAVRARYTNMRFVEPAGVEGVGN